MSTIEELTNTIKLLNDTFNAQIDTLNTKIESNEAIVHAEIDSFWLIFSACLVFFMQAGFSLVEAGSVRAKNVNNILYKNLMDAAVGFVSFWLFGFGFAYGTTSDDNGFIGTSNFALWRETDNNNPYQGYVNFFFQWAFAATAATIVSGAVAERTKIIAYFLYSIFLTSFVYPVVVHWVWDGEGWLSGKLIDFAGSGVVHMVGGFSALVGAIFVGPRQGRFDDGADLGYPELMSFKSHKVYDLRGHSALLAALGVSILWLGWYGFNCGSTLAIYGSGTLASKVAVTTSMSAATGAITVTIIHHFTSRIWDLWGSLNGVLAGLVGITAGCSVVEPWGALIIGIISGIVYLGSSHLLKRFKVDDPLDAFSVHGACGIWGVLAAGIFATTDGATFAGYDRNDQIKSAEQVGTQLIGILAIAAWTLATSSILFFIIKITVGIRVDPDIEKEGLDITEHGGSAYKMRPSINLSGSTATSGTSVSKPSEGTLNSNVNV